MLWSRGRCFRAYASSALSKAVSLVERPHRSIKAGAWATLDVASCASLPMLVRRCLMSPDFSRSGRARSITEVRQGCTICALVVIIRQSSACCDAVVAWSEHKEYACLSSRASIARFFSTIEPVTLKHLFGPKRQREREALLPRCVG